jgi:catechol 2,3-dioxygenase-like lactoylglutathione lyase family enzyme
VRDVEASADWYVKVFQGMRLPITFPHHDCEETGYAVLVVVPGSDVIIGLHHNAGNDGAEFDESSTGLDHFGFSVADRAAMQRWVERLDGMGIEHSGVRDITEPIPFSTLVFRDPDNIQLELYAG